MMLIDMPFVDYDTDKKEDLIDVDSEQAITDFLKRKEK